MAEPTFGDLDIGQPGGALFNAGHAEAIIRVLTGPIEIARADFAMPGLDGVFETRMGKRGRRIVWEATILAESEATLNVIEQEIELYQRTDGEYEMIWYGRGAEYVRLEAYRRIGSRQRMKKAGWLMQQAEIEFRDMIG